MSFETALQDSIDAAIADRDNIKVRRAQNLFRFTWRQWENPLLFSLEWHLNVSVLQSSMLVNTIKTYIQPDVLVQLEDISLELATMHKLETA